MISPPAFNTTAGQLKLKYIDEIRWVTSFSLDLSLRCNSSFISLSLLFTLRCQGTAITGHSIGLVYRHFKCNSTFSIDASTNQLVKQSALSYTLMKSYQRMMMSMHECSYNIVPWLKESCTLLFLWCRKNAFCSCGWWSSASISSSLCFKLLKFSSAKAIFWISTFILNRKTCQKSQNRNHRMIQATVVEVFTVN